MNECRGQGGVMGGDVKKRALVRWQSTGGGGGIDGAFLVSDIMCGQRIRAAVRKTGCSPLRSVCLIAYSECMRCQYTVVGSSQAKQVFWYLPTSTEVWDISWKLDEP